MFSYRPAGWQVVALLSVVLVFSARVCFYAFAAEANEPDLLRWNRWGKISQNLAEGHGYSETNLVGYFPGEGFNSTASRSPVPVLVNALSFRLFGVQALPILVFNWILDAACAAVIVFAVWQVSRSVSWSAVASCLYVGYLPANPFSIAIGATSIAHFLLTITVLCFVSAVTTGKWRWSFGVGFLCGALSLTTPAALPLIGMFVLLFFAFRPRAFPGSLLAIGAFLLTITPWIARNAMVFGAFVPATTLGGYNLFRHNCFLGDVNYREVLDLRGEGTRRALETLERAGVHPPDTDEVTIDVTLSKAAMKIIRQYPLRYAELSLRRIVSLWTYKFPYRTAEPFRTISWLYWVGSIASAVLATLGLVWHSTEARPYVLTAAWCLVFYHAVHLPIVGTFRYLFPLLGTLTIAATLQLRWLYGILREDH